mgnify:CR=1 FL=1
MKNEAFKNRFKELLDCGGSNFVTMHHNEEILNFQKRITSAQYHFCINTTYDMFEFTTRDERFRTPLTEVKDFVIKALWGELGNVPVSEDDEIEVKFLHFDEFCDRTDIWHWFEWYFNITLGDYFKQ